MHGHTHYSHDPSNSTDFDANGLFHNDQFQSPDDPLAANEISRMADELPLDHPAFRSDPEQFEHFERRDGIIDQEWNPYQAASQDRLQRDQEMSLRTSGSLSDTLAPHTLVDRHDSVATGDGQYEKQAASPSNQQTTAENFTCAQSIPCEDFIYEIQQHLFGPHIDKSNDQHISEAEWQFYEAGVQEFQSFQMPEAMAEPSYTDFPQPDHGTSGPSYMHDHDQVVGSDMLLAPMNGVTPEPFDILYENTVSNAHGNHTYHPSAPLLPHWSQTAFQEGPGNYAYPKPYPGDYGIPAHQDQDIPMPPTYTAFHPVAPAQQASSAAQNQAQAIAPRTLLSEEQKVHLANLVQSKQVAYGDQINTMILSHGLDYFPLMPLIAFPKQQERPKFDHGLPDQYEHLSTDDILAGGVHPDQMFGGLLLRLCKSYNNKELGAKIDALYGKKLSASTYAHRITDAVDAFAVKEHITAEQFRARLNRQRPAQASKY